MKRDVCHSGRTFHNWLSLNELKAKVECRGKWSPRQRRTSDKKKKAVSLKPPPHCIKLCQMRLNKILWNDARWLAEMNSLAECGLIVSNVTLTHGKVILIHFKYEKKGCMISTRLHHWHLIGCNYDYDSDMCSTQFPCYSHALACQSHTRDVSQALGVRLKVELYREMEMLSLGRQLYIESFHWTQPPARDFKYSILTRLYSLRATR